MMTVIFEKDGQEKADERAGDKARHYSEERTLVLHNHRVTGEPVPGSSPVSRNLLLVGEPCASYDFTRENSTGKPARPRTNCWEQPVNDRCTRSKKFATQKASDKEPLKAFEAAIHRPMYNKSATVPTQTDTPQKKIVETQIPKCDTDVDLAACNVHPFYFALCRGNPVLTEQYVRKRPTKRELVNERVKQARQAATDPAAGQTPAYVPTEAIDLDMFFAEPPLYHTPPDFMQIASATSTGSLSLSLSLSLSVDISQDEEDNILEIIQIENEDQKKKGRAMNKLTQMQTLCNLRVM